ncbi:glycosyltransferase [Croceicoccus sp. YJ47]|uniref:glycosyltransferase n=1 Tax=Croceicoccus sp. YJ47 TaxID=2798724 RepID=UPI001920649E|nr:glycosyltransferase [Croceicoccus sp. YJ47]QQN72986.1 glycosyltransferase [Croceicoccus sp. YJ47]
MQGPLAGRTIGLLSPWASRLGGGVFEAVVAHSEMLREAGARVHVFALADRHSEEDRGRFHPDTIVHTVAGRGPGAIGYAPTLIDTMLSAPLDLLHLHGIWQYASYAGQRWAAKTGRPYVISPHGMLDPWIVARGKAKKAAARLVYERRSWKRASVLHALTGSEAADIAREAGRRDSIVIPNAGPAPGPMPTEGRAPAIGYIGRIHPKKNIAALVEAWHRLDGEGRLPSDARLTIAGWGAEEDVAALKSLLKKGSDTAQFVGPVFGAEKERILHGSRFIALPSHSEGLPMAMLEAWAVPTPTIMTTNCNLPEGFAAGAALDCGVAVDTIAATLYRALTMDDSAWLAMAGAARDLMEGAFSAATVRARWSDAYLELIEA